MTDQNEIDPLEASDLRTDQIDTGLLQLAQERSEDAGHTVESEAHIINRALFLYLTLENPDELLTEPPTNDETPGFERQ